MASPTLLGMPVEIQLKIWNLAIITEVAVCPPEHEFEDQGSTFDGLHNKHLGNPNLSLLLVNHHLFNCVLPLIPQAVDLHFSTLLCAHYHFYNSPGLPQYVSKITTSNFTKGVYGILKMASVKQANETGAWELLEQYVPVNSRATSTWGPMLQVGSRRFHKYTTVIETGISTAPRVTGIGRIQRNARKRMKKKVKKQVARNLRVALAKARAMRRP